MGFVAADGAMAGAGRTPSVARFVAQSVLAIAATIVAYLVARQDYLLFHSAVEGFSVVVAALIYVVGVRSPDDSNSFWSFLSGVFLAIAILTSVHLLTYKGMSVLPGYGTDTPTQLWIATRYVYAFGVLAAPLFLTRRLAASFSTWLFAGIAILLLASIMWLRIFPTSYVEGEGLTPFKVSSEYLVCLLLGLAAVHLRSRRGMLEKTVYRLLVVSIVANAAADLSFTLYTDVYGVMNFLGHVLAAGAYYCLYRAVVIGGLDRPYNELRSLNRELEARVADRTASVEATNRDLRAEVEQRRLAQMAAEESEERVRKLSRAVEQSPTSVVITDIDGRIEYVNPKFTRLTGYSLAEAVGQNPRILKSDVTPPEEYVRMWSTIAAGGEWRGEFCNRKKNGELYWELASISPVRDADGKITHFVAVKEDITERKRADEEIRKLNDDLEQRASQLEAVNAELAAFSYSVSHDLRAPLRRLDGFSEALLEDYAHLLGGDGQDYLNRIRASVRGMSQLVEDLLRLSRVTSGEMHRERVDLTEIAESIASELRKSCPARRSEFIIQAGLVVEGDPRLLEVALQNLLGNAWKFTGNQEEARVEFGASDLSGERTFFVRDNGVGFDPMYASKLFGAFQRLHSDAEFQGTGIGLATVQRIIRRHGGRIWAEGALGSGATFSFTLG